MRVSIRHQDLTQLRVDVIVNAANSWLGHGGGVARALREAGGPRFVELSNDFIERYGAVPEGAVCHTEAGGMLPCRWVVHAVGPVHRHGWENQLLARAFRNRYVRE